MAEKYTSIKTVAASLQRHPLFSDVTLEYIVDLGLSFMRILGMPRMFEEKIETIEIEDYRGKLPCDWIQTIQIKYDRDKCFSPALRHSTDSFHLNPSKHRSHSVDKTFKVQGDIIYTSFKEGKIQMSYLAIPLDGEGLPMIPDNSKYMRALEYYIRKEYFTILFDMAKISLPVLQNAQQQYSFYVGQAQNDFVKLDISRAESLFNGWSTLLPRNNTFVEGFANLGTKEHIRIKR